MAQGTFLLFNKFEDYKRDQVVGLEGGSWKVALCSDPVTSLLVSETNPALGSTNINEVSAGGGYTSGGIALTLASTDTAGLYTFALDTGTHSGGTLAWSSAAGSPTNIKSAVLYDDAATSPANAAAGYWDMTTDGGTTPLDLTAVDINLNAGANGGNAGEIFVTETNP